MIVLLKRVIASFFLALFLALATASMWALWPEEQDFDAAPLRAAGQSYDVRVLRDRYGVPHIYGRSDPDVAFGLAYAHAEDDFDTIQRVLLATRGTLARVEGADAAPLDYMVRLMGFWRDVHERWESDLSPEARALADGYAAGTNLYAAEHPDEVLPGAIPVNGKDIAAGFAFKTPLFYGLQQQVIELLEEEPQRSLALEPSEDAFHLTTRPPPILGSNAVAVAPGRSEDGATRLLVNSHQPYTGPVSWYEARLKSDEGWDMVGGVFPGAPVILHGTGPTLGWASTVNSPDLADIYVLEINPENEDQYRLDGQWRDFERDEARIEVKLFGRLRWTLTRELLRSVHGPVLRTDHGVYAIRYVGAGEIRGLEQWYRMNRARSFEQWRDAMALQAIPSLNFVYADQAGNVGYLYNARFPRRAPGWDWKAYLPGDRSELIWTEYWPFEQVPAVLNPSSGFVVSANHTPFRATAPGEGPQRADYPPEHGIETRMTNRALRGLELYGGDSKISAQEFRRYKYDKRYSERSAAAEIVQGLLARDWGGEPEVAPALDVLRRWGLSTEADDTSAALAILTATPLVVAQIRELPLPDPVESFRDAIDTLLEHHGRLDPPWGDVNRMRRGGIDVPAGGGPDVLRAIESFVLEDDGTYTARTGDSYLMFIEWDAAGKQRVETIHQFGSATLDPESPHYADQLPLFLAEKTKSMPLSEAELREQGILREYRPGQDLH